MGDELRRLREENKQLKEAGWQQYTKGMIIPNDFYFVEYINHGEYGYGITSFRNDAFSSPYDQNRVVLRYMKQPVHAPSQTVMNFLIEKLSEQEKIDLANQIRKTIEAKTIK